MAGCAFCVAYVPEQLDCLWGCDVTEPHACPTMLAATDAVPDMYVYRVASQTGSHKSVVCAHMHVAHELSGSAEGAT